MSERERRWRLLLGEPSGLPLASPDTGLDECLEALYEPGEGKRRGGLGGSLPKVSRWLGDIRSYFPSSVVRVLQKDAMEQLGLQKLLLDPEFLAAVEPDVHLVATLLGLSQVMPEKTKATARQVVAGVVAELMKRLADATRSAVNGSLRQSKRRRRPRLADIDWSRTVKANLKHYQVDYRSIIPETLWGRSRGRSALAEVVLCVDQSGSMASSVVYASLFAAVLASVPALSTRLVVFDTAVVDLSELLADPVEVLFGTQLGGGTDIARALAYCQQCISRPNDTVLILISDLYEGGDAAQMAARIRQLVESGVNTVGLLALSDEGTPQYDHHHAVQLAALGMPVFACTPDQFPEMMAAALRRSDLNLWAARHGIVADR